ncbi:hypothetical protein ACJX0J_018385 [Zea mays]
MTHSPLLVLFVLSLRGNVRNRITGAYLKNETANVYDTTLKILLFARTLYLNIISSKYRSNNDLFHFILYPHNSIIHDIMPHTTFGNYSVTMPFLLLCSHIEVLIPFFWSIKYSNTMAYPYRSFDLLEAVEVRRHQYSSTHFLYMYMYGVRIQLVEACLERTKMSLQHQHLEIKTQQRLLESFPP